MNLFVGIEEVIEKLAPLWRGLGEASNNLSPFGEPVPHVREGWGRNQSTCPPLEGVGGGNHPFE